jgi:hypothetical protein
MFQTFKHLKKFKVEKSPIFETLTWETIICGANVANKTIYLAWICRWFVHANQTLKSDYDARVHIKFFFLFWLKPISGQESRDDYVTIDNIKLSRNTFTNLAPTHSIGPKKIQMKQKRLWSDWKLRNHQAFFPEKVLHWNKKKGFYMNSGIVIDMASYQYFIKFLKVPKIHFKIIRIQKFWTDLLSSGTFSFSRRYSLSTRYRANWPGRPLCPFCGYIPIWRTSTSCFEPIFFLNIRCRLFALTAKFNIGQIFLKKTRKWSRSTCRVYMYVGSTLIFQIPKSGIFVIEISFENFSLGLPKGWSPRS